MLFNGLSGPGQSERPIEDQHSDQQQYEVPKHFIENSIQHDLPLTKNDLMQGVQTVEVVPFHPDVKWLGWWEIEPVKFLQQYIPLAIWSGLGITCKNEPIRYPVGAQKLPQKIRQRFICPNASSHPREFAWKYEKEGNKSWTSGSCTCWIDYELKWKNHQKKEFIVRFQVTIYRQKCISCRGENYVKGALQYKVLAGIINRFVERIATKVKFEINNDAPRSIQVDFAKQQPCRSVEIFKGILGQDSIPVSQIFLKYSENPLFLISHNNDDDDGYNEYSYQGHYQSKGSRNLKINWWDVNHLQTLFRQNHKRQQNVKEAKGDNYKVKEDLPHSQQRCEACEFQRCMFANKIKPDDVGHCIIDIDEDAVESQKGTDTLIDNKPESRPQPSELPIVKSVSTQQTTPAQSVLPVRRCSQSNRVLDETPPTAQQAKPKGLLSLKERSMLLMIEAQEQVLAAKKTKRKEVEQRKPAEVTWKTLNKNSTVNKELSLQQHIHPVLNVLGAELQLGPAKDASVLTEIEFNAPIEVSTIQSCTIFQTKEKEGQNGISDSDIRTDSDYSEHMDTRQEPSENLERILDQINDGDVSFQQMTT